MSQHLTISAGEAADRLAIRELIEAYAHCADRRDARGRMSLFTADTHFEVYRNARSGLRRSCTHAGRSLQCFADLNKVRRHHALCRVRVRLLA